MIFVDTGALLARYVAADQFHAKAVFAWERLAEDRQRCFTSNFVLNETFTLLARRTGYPFAAQRARNMLDSGTLRILRPGPEQEREAVELLAKYADQKVGFTDCLSFVLMREARVRRAFSFDRHFEDAGFELWPS